jgi:oligopeptide transport system substrate-binding protein
MAKSVPWLTLDKSAVPVVGYLGFNVKKAPFDNRLVRQAFAAAIDRKAIAALAVTLQGTQNARSAVTFTPPETLGRDLTGQVAVYDPVKARALLAQAGYPDGKGFPEITLASGSADAVFRLASAAVAAWNENLKINAKVQKIEGNYGDYIVRNDPNAIHFFLRIPEYNDPDSFLLAVYHTRARSNFGHFANAEFDRLVEQAAAATDPATRQALYISAERLLLDQEAATIPIYYLTFRQQ